MTIDETIEQLESVIDTYEILLGNGVNSDILDVDDLEAIKVAIASLEALEKVKAEIDESRDALKTMIDGEWFAGKLKGLDCAVAIIDKHLQVIKNG